LLAMAAVLLPGTFAQAADADIVITEIMQNPAILLDDVGEWFEVHNTGATPVNLDGWTIKDLGTDSHIVASGGTAIVPAGLTVSVHLATFGLAYLVVIHKLEYLLNSRIIGGCIDTPMWMTLLGLVVGEAMMGVPGILLAPALLHYARAELRDLPAPATP